YLIAHRAIPETPAPEHTSVGFTATCKRSAAALTEAKPLINANGREWKRMKRMKRSCFTVDCAADHCIHFLLESIRVHSRSFAVLFVGAHGVAAAFGIT